MNDDLQLPGVNKGFSYPGLSSNLSNQPLGVIISQFMGVILFIAGFLSLIWFAWGVFEYIFAGGNKETLGKARKKMTWAIIGFILFTLSFAMSQYAQTIFEPKDRPIQNLNIPNTQ